MILLRNLVAALLVVSSGLSPVYAGKKSRSGSAGDRTGDHGDRNKHLSGKYKRTFSQSSLGVASHDGGASDGSDEELQGEIAFDKYLQPTIYDFENLLLSVMNRVRSCGKEKDIQEFEMRDMLARNFDHLYAQELTQKARSKAVKKFTRELDTRLAQ